MLLETDGWPLVLEDDDGIRPRGAPDECFYCNRKVGEEHGPECVTVHKVVAYTVLDLDGVVVGTYERSEPYSWDADDCQFHKNESSWCKDNSLDEIVWTTPQTEERVREELAVLGASGRCACSYLTFRINGVVRPGPLVERPYKERKT